MSIVLPSLPGLGDALEPQVAPNAPLSSQAIQAQRDYAKALMTGNVAKGTGPQFPVVQSWTQGVSNMVNALLGGGEAYNANQREAASRNADAANTDMTNGKRSFKEGSSSEGHEKTADDDTDREAKAIASIESKGSGDYSAVGPQTHTGDRAYGKYQVMGANIPSWTQEVLGKPMSAQEFLGSPEAQEAVFKTKFAQGGNNDSDRASVWFTGKPLAQGANRSDGYITGQQYVDRFNKAMGAPSGGATAFAGPDGGAPANPAVQAMSAALRGDTGPQVAEGTQVAAARGGGAPGAPMPAPNGTGTYVDPRLVQPRPQLTHDQMMGIMRSPTLDPQTKLMYQQQYLHQNDPIDMPYLGGTVRIDPNNPSRQQYFPKVETGTKKLPGGLEKPYPYTVGPGPNNGITINPGEATGAAGPRSEAAPAAPVAPAGAPAAPAQGGAALASAAAPQAAPARVAATAPTKPVQVASLDPAAGVTPAPGELSPIQKQMMAMAGPNQPVTGVTPEAKPAATGTPVEVAENAAKTPPMNPLAQAIRTKPPSSDYSDEDWKSITGYKDLERQNDIDKEAGIKGVDAAMKKYDTLSTQAQNARKLMPSIDTAQALMKDPNFYSGIGAGEVQTWNKLKSAFPSLFGKDAAFAAAPNEVFNKVIAGSILDNMRTALGGLGQVRLAEIDLLKQASASNNNTPAANRALLELSRRSLQSLDHLDEMGQAYQSGDEVTDPITGKSLLKANLNANGEPQPRRGLDVGFDKLARQFVLDHPTTTPEEAADYKKLFASDGKDEPKPPPSNGAPPKITTQEEYNALPSGPYIAPDGSQRIKK